MEHNQRHNLLAAQHYDLAWHFRLIQVTLGSTRSTPESLGGNVFPYVRKEMFFISRSFRVLTPDKQVAKELDTKCVRKGKTVPEFCYTCCCFRSELKSGESET